MRIAIGSDHAGYRLKLELIRHLEQQGHVLSDVGCNDEQSCDYPDFARLVAEQVSGGAAERGLLVCGTGQGMAMTANRVPGVRAAVCSDTFSARLSRQHNDASVLCIGARVVGPGLATELVDAFLSTPFEGGRHQRRVDKINATA